jgi:diguanylate cyclase (GGDEF)-like protein
MIVRSITALLPVLTGLAHTSPSEAAHRLRRQRGYYFASVLLLALSVGAVGWTIWQLRTDAVRAAVSDSENIASILSGQLARLLDSIDNVLSDIKKSVSEPHPERPQDLQAAFDTQQFHDALTQHLRRLPWIFNIAIADANGQVVVSTAGWPTPQVNVADRDYFIEAKAQSGDQVNASVPINNRINGTRTIVFAKRLQASNGAFLGIVYASVNSAYFEDIYGSVQSINSVLFTLVRKDGTILFRHPDPSGTAGRKLSAEAAWLDALSRGEKGFRIQAFADGNVRFVASHAVPQYPLFVNISVTEESALAGWRWRAATIGAGSFILLLCSIGLLISVTKQMRRLNESEAELAHLAHYDTLTGLANRTLFAKKVDEAVLRMRSGQHFSIFMLDLDQFKAVNDSLGHAVGDALLKSIGSRLKGAMGPHDSAARLGGDEFAILHPLEGSARGDAGILANRILEIILKPYDIEGRKIIIGTSIGIAIAPSDGSDADTLTRNADLSLYKSKSRGRNRFHFFDNAIEAGVRDRRALEDDLSKAISFDEFELAYQPVIELKAGKVAVVEALVRWRHPKRGLIFPGDFIPLAEQSGLIVPLGEKILRQACSDAAAWPARIKLAVNLSPAQFKQSDLLGVVRSALADSGLSPERLELEITETVLLEGDEKSLSELRALKEMGVSIVLDDFGIGYSSMKYLQMFPFDKIKIDKSFIQSMTMREDSAAIVCAIAGLGRALEMQTTAEGVETVEQLELVRTAGCQLAQGYLFGRPVPLRELNLEGFNRKQDSSVAA